MDESGHEALYDLRVGDRLLRRTLFVAAHSALQFARFSTVAGTLKYEFVHYLSIYFSTYPDCGPVAVLVVVLVAAKAPANCVYL